MLTAEEGLPIPLNRLLDEAKRMSTKNDIRFAQALCYLCTWLDPRAGSIGGEDDPYYDESKIPKYLLRIIELGIVV